MQSLSKTKKINLNKPSNQPKIKSIKLKIKIKKQFKHIFNKSIHLNQLISHLTYKKLNLLNKYKQCIIKYNYLIIKKIYLATFHKKVKNNCNF